MIKGTSKRIIVVKSPDPKIFEEAIFIVREDYLRSRGISQAKLLSDAKRAAGGYMEGIKRPESRSRTGLIISLSTLCGSGLCYGVLKLLSLGWLT